MLLQQHSHVAALVIAQVADGESGLQGALEALGGSQTALQGLKGKVKSADAKLQVGTKALRSSPRELARGLAINGYSPCHHDGQCSWL